MANASPSVFYHSSIGTVNLVDRPRLHSLSIDQGNTCTKLWHGSGYCFDAWVFKLVTKVEFYIIRLGCGKFLKFAAGDLLVDGSRLLGAVELGELLTELPLEIEIDHSHLMAFPQ